MFCVFLFCSATYQLSSCSDAVGNRLKHTQIVFNIQISLWSGLHVLMVGRCRKAKCLQVGGCKPSCHTNTEANQCELYNQAHSALSMRQRPFPSGVYE